MNKNKKPLSVWLYVPNIIGYLRFLLSMTAGYFFHCYRICIPCYAISFSLDWADGAIARYFNQTSQFGALLDMFVDRGSITILYCILSGIYPQFVAMFMFFAFMDVASHFVRIYISLLSHHKSHKIVDENTPFPLFYYYKNRFVMGMFCVNHEVFLMLLYLLYFINFLSPQIGGLLRGFLVFEEKAHRFVPKSLETNRLAPPSFINPSLYPQSSSYFGHFNDFANNHPVLSLVISVYFLVAFVLFLGKILIHIEQLYIGLKEMAELDAKKKKGLLLQNESIVNNNKEDKSGNRKENEDNEKKEEEEE